MLGEESRFGTISNFNMKYFFAGEHEILKSLKMKHTLKKKKISEPFSPGDKAELKTPMEINRAISEF